jgi:hypothetical protein
MGRNTHQVTDDNSQGWKRVGGMFLSECIVEQCESVVSAVLMLSEGISETPQDVYSSMKFKEVHLLITSLTWMGKVCSNVASRSIWYCCTKYNGRGQPELP